MAVKSYQPGAKIVGNFDFLDTDLPYMHGGEIVVFDEISTDSNDRSSPDVYKAGSKRTLLRLATGADTGPFLIAELPDEGLFHQPGFEVTSLYAKNQPFAKETAASGKIGVYVEEGFYVVNSDVVDSTTVNSNTAVGARLYSDSNGHLTATPSASGAIVGFFVEFQSGELLRGFPSRFGYAATHKTGDSIVFFKSNADGYLNLDLVAQAIGGVGELGAPSDGYFSDGYLELSSSTKIADAFDAINEYLASKIPNPDFFEVNIAVDIFVDPVNGSDDTGDGSADSPFYSVQRAINSIPDGFLCQVNIRCLPGVLPDTDIIFTPKPGTVVIDKISTYTMLPEINLVGSTNVLEEITTTGSSSALVSAGGIQKAAKRQIATTQAFQTSPTTGLHFLVPQESVMNNTTSRVLFQSPAMALSESRPADSVLAYLSAFGMSTTLNLCTLATSGYNIVNIIGHEQYKCNVRFFDFSDWGLSSRTKGVNFFACRTRSIFNSEIGSETLWCCAFVPGSSSESSFTLAGRNSAIYGCYFNSNSRIHIMDGVIGNLLGCVFEASGVSLQIGGDGNAISHFGHAGVQYMYNLDFENGGVHVSGGYVVHGGGNISFENTTTPIRVSRKGYWYRRNSGLVTGSGSSYVVIETGAYGENLRLYTYTNTSNPGEEIKVGARAVQSFASIPSTGVHDFAEADSQGCRST